MKKKLFELIMQIIQVMIGVYFGFVISNWGEQQKNISKSRVLNENIKKEMSINKSKLDAVIEYHKILRDSSSVYLRKFSKNKLDKPPAYFKGVQTPTLIESAYNTGIQTGIITIFEIDKIQALNQLYIFQKEYNKFKDIVLERIKKRRIKSAGNTA